MRFGFWQLLLNCWYWLEEASTKCPYLRLGVVLAAVSPRLIYSNISLGERYWPPVRGFDGVKAPCCLKLIFDTRRCLHEKTSYMFSSSTSSSHLLTLTMGDLSFYCYYWLPKNFFLNLSCERISWEGIALSSAAFGMLSLPSKVTESTLWSRSSDLLKRADTTS